MDYVGCIGSDTPPSHSRRSPPRKGDDRKKDPKDKEGDDGKVGLRRDERERESARERSREMERKACVDGRVKRVKRGRAVGQAPAVLTDWREGLRVGGLGSRAEGEGLD